MYLFFSFSFFFSNLKFSYFIKWGERLWLGYKMKYYKSDRWFLLLVWHKGRKKYFLFGNTMYYKWVIPFNETSMFRRKKEKNTMYHKRDCTESCLTTLYLPKISCQLWHNIHISTVQHAFANYSVVLTKNMLPTITNIHISTVQHANTTDRHHKFLLFCFSLNVHGFESIFVRTIKHNAIIDLNLMFL